MTKRACSTEVGTCQVPVGLYGRVEGQDRVRVQDVVNVEPDVGPRPAEPQNLRDAEVETIDGIGLHPLGRESFFDDRAVRRAAMMHEVPCITTLTGAAPAVSAIRALRRRGVDVRALQDDHAGIAGERV